MQVLLRNNATCIVHDIYGKKVQRWKDAIF